ncbi:methyl-accepting chemotaxis protein [Mesoterricola silvestris]|uniref:Methyl-accepting chemotaxis protein n=1 Tax=Mesoterricola silvestris TaxID=2927979 RepID=A0AA48GSZ5_9BACT|nr:methyl-accepting chemotaxis protein [Mesoterricola silvestris]BDU73740.1 methyl-accepting chemotaxis protein [Mesoterricola silvestris]
MKIGQKFSVISGAMIACTTAAMMLLSLTIMYRALGRQASTAQEGAMKTLIELLDQKGKGFRISDGKLFVGDCLLNDNNELPDKVKALCGGTATLFMGDTRVATNVMTPEGKRAIGTKLQGPAREAVLGRGERYRGEASILGETYLAAYDPIKNAAGETIGVLFVGIEKSEYFSSFYQMIWIVAGMTATALVVAYFIVSHFANKMTRPLSRIAAGMEHSDLTLTLEAGGDDEVGALSKAFNAYNHGLKERIQHVADFAGRVASGSTELSASADEIERTVTEIAKVSENLKAEGESVTEAIGDLSKNAGVVAASTKESEQESRNAVLDTERSAEAGENVVRSMDEIQAVMKQIVGAVQVIKEIANQTNLLSLNAAIEAAKAGTHGKGFAVVAEEVRKLAERSGTAAKEIEGLIQRTGAAVEGGMTSVNANMESLDAIRKRITGMASKIQRIGDVADGQAATSAQVSASMSSTALGLAQNATATHELTATVHEIAKTSEDLSRVAEGLQGLVKEFRL